MPRNAAKTLRGGVGSGEFGALFLEGIVGGDEVSRVGYDMQLVTSEPTYLRNAHIWN